jgi:hypothetical protein
LAAPHLKRPNRAVSASHALLPASIQKLLTLYEAVALGILIIREQEWAGKIAEGLNTVDVSVSNVPVTHSVMMQDFTKWLHRNGGTPREITHRNRIREILGIGEDGKS